MTRDQRMLPAILRIAWTLSLFMTAPLDAQSSASPSSQATREQPRSADALRVSAPTQYKIDHPSDAGAFLIDIDNTTIDLRGSTIMGADEKTPANEYVGRAIIIRKAKNVTIKNVNIRGFKVAIYAEDAPGLRLENCDVSNNYRMRLKSTPQREHTDDWLWPHQNDNDEWLRYGAGIYLLRCDNAKIMTCRARNGQNGICISRSNRVEVIENDMSFMSGWGLAMHRSNHCQVIRNRFDYCVRGYSHGVYFRGQDSTGILVFEQCSDNVFAYNSATHGGDGFFLYAGDETLKVTGTGGCNRNLVCNNDFSHAVANGIEATFSDENAFIANTLDNCDHGIWAGYSTRTIIRGNVMRNCAHGVSIEHGRDNRIEWNDFISCRRGVWLWWDDDADLLKSVYCQRQGHRSEREALVYNLFKECNEAVLLSSSNRAKVTNNRMERCEIALRLKDKSDISEFYYNRFVGGLIENDTRNVLLGAGNLREREPETALIGKVTLDEKTDFLCMEGVESGCREGPLTQLATSRPVPDFSPKHPVCSGTMRPSPYANFEKSTIVIDEWGPCDFSEARVFPSRITGAMPVMISLIGPPGTPFKFLSQRDSLWEASPAEGKTPAVVTLKPLPNAPPGVHSIDLGFRIGDVERRVTGQVVHGSWTVRYFTWTDAMDPREKDENWQTIINAKPLRSEDRGNLELTWGGGGPTPDVKERFALVAETRLKLSAGRWRLRTISDDGIRVYFDGKRVIDNWTWHVPTEDSNVVDVKAAGEHDIRVEYFEITGHAQLQFFLEPVETVSPTSAAPPATP